AGEKLAAFALTEATAGSDAASLKTSAVQNEKGFLLNGEKIYISNAEHADVFLVFARINEKADDSKIAAFLIEKQQDGLNIGKAEPKMGCHGSSISSLLLENCQLPKTALLGETNQGFKIALSGLAPGRVSIAAAACGISSSAIQIAGNHLKNRKQFGQSLSEFQGLRFMLADMLIQQRSAILGTRASCEEIDSIEAQGSRPKNSIASFAKCAATDAAMSITTDAVQLLGGAGYLKEYQVEKLMRDAKMLQIVEGTNQIQREIIAKDYFRKS
ncbi:UNVERIFIED_CONTAM: hypothetical protein GTU68_051583, partial [Idotea baltica]|nr:hypothetical protein [Idotea baltica]